MITPFIFELVHPVLYAQTIVIQAENYTAAVAYAQAHCTGTLWTIAKATNQLTGEVMPNG